MAGLPATTSIANWNRATQHVEEAVRPGRYINAETALVFVGPPRMTDIGGLNANVIAASQSTALGPTQAGGTDALYPVGLVESFQMQQAQNVAKLFEIGSRRSYQQGGRVQVVGSLGRVVFYGPSLLRVLYAYYPNVIQLANGRLLQGGSDSVGAAMLTAGQGLLSTFPQIYFEPGSYAAADPEGGGPPNSFFINLMSELFSFPFGMGIILRDNSNQNYGAFYCEDCFVTTHSFGISSSSSLVTEAINFQCDAAVPMEFSTDTGSILPDLASAIAG
jgi:hypothetical protein